MIRRRVRIVARRLGNQVVTSRRPFAQSSSSRVSPAAPINSSCSSNHTVWYESIIGSGEPDGVAGVNLVQCRGQFGGVRVQARQLRAGRRQNRQDAPVDVVEAAQHRSVVVGVRVIVGLAVPELPLRDQRLEFPVHTAELVVGARERFVVDAAPFVGEELGRGVPDPPGTSGRCCRRPEGPPR